MSRGLLVWLVVAGLVALGGVTAGRALKGPGPEPLTFETQAPPYDGADIPGAVTRGGFSGFGATGGFGGAAIVAGKVTAISANTVTLNIGAGTNTIRVTGGEKLRALQPFQGSVSAGMTVVILNKPGTQDAAAVLAVLEP